jgi:vacuolar-type H+-ATPase subunit F/Vma7
MIDLAILYAESEQNSSNYYVLIFMTDEQINDFDETVDRVVKASTLPLSIVIVGIGDKDLSLI